MGYGDVPEAFHGFCSLAVRMVSPPRGLKEATECEECGAAEGVRGTGSEIRSASVRTGCAISKRG